MKITEGDITQALINSQRETIEALQKTVKTLEAQVADLKSKQGWQGGTTFIPNTTNVPYMPAYTLTNSPALTGATGITPFAVGSTFQQGRDIRVANAQA